MLGTAAAIEFIWTLTGVDLTGQLVPAAAVRGREIREIRMPLDRGESPRRVVQNATHHHHRKGAAYDRYD